MSLRSGRWPTVFCIDVVTACLQGGLEVHEEQWTAKGPAWATKVVWFGKSTDFEVWGWGTRRKRRGGRCLHDHSVNMMIFPPFDRDNERNLEVKEPPEQATSSKQKQGQRCAWGWGRLRDPNIELGSVWRKHTKTYFLKASIFSIHKHARLVLWKLFLLLKVRCRDSGNSSLDSSGLTWIRQQTWQTFWCIE